MVRKDVVIPMVFPDYLIMVETPEVRIDVPDFLPFVPNEVKIPKSKSRVPYLGHAGVLFFDGPTGTTKYYEYGRYDPAAKGLVRKQRVPNVQFRTDGRPTAGSLKLVLATISRVSGQGGRLLGAY